MSKKTIILISFIIAKFVLQYALVNPIYNLQRDEFLHLDQANHLAWGYISVPPVTSWLSCVVGWLGNGVFWVRFVPTLFGALTLLLVWKIIEELNGKLFALVLGTVAVMLSAILRVNVLYQPNSLDVFFWCFFYYTFIKYINTSRPVWLYIMALSVGFGILSKYNFLFLLMGFLPAILLSEHRVLFARKSFLISVAIAFAIVLPNIIWQYQHHFPTLTQLHELNATQLVNVKRIDFIKDQILYFLGSSFIIIGAFVGLVVYPPFKKYRLFLYGYILTLSIYIFLKGKSYYAIGLYPVLICFGSVFLESLSTYGISKLLRPLAIGIVLALAVPLLTIGFPTKTPVQIAANNGMYKTLGLLRWEDGTDHAIPQDFADMLGWQELANKVEIAYHSMPQKYNTLILCDNYGEAGAINYYAKDKSIRAVSFNADYINWIDFDKKYTNLIRIKTDSGGKKEELKKTSPFFEKGYEYGSITDTLAREYGTTIFVFEHAKIDISNRLKKEADEKRY